VRVRLQVRPGDFSDVEFESFTGMLAVLEGMSKSLHNTDWLAAPLSEEDLLVTFDAIEHLRNIFEKHREGQAAAGHEWDKGAVAGSGEPTTEVSLSYRPRMTNEI
jgi:hypothetical protein